MPKEPWLAAFGPQIFFDDQEAYCKPASRLVPTAIVPFPITPLPSAAPEVNANDGARKNQFLLICKGYLKRHEALKTPAFEEWYAGNLATLDPAVADAFLGELAASVEGTPSGAERPAKGESQTKAAKFLDFLDALMRKHRRTN